MRLSACLCFAVCGMSYGPCPTLALPRQQQRGIWQSAKGKRVGIYLRVSTTGQTTENQRLELERVAEERGWQIVAVHEDHGISPRTGALGRLARRTELFNGGRTTWVSRIVTTCEADRVTMGRR